MSDKYDWGKLAAIGSPEKWIEVYKHYQELLVNEDAIAWLVENKDLNMVGNQDACVQFGRWLLKHAETAFNEDGLLCWKYKGRFVDTADMYDIYTKNEDDYN